MPKFKLERLALVGLVFLSTSFILKSAYLDWGRNQYTAIAIGVISVLLLAYLED